MSQDLRNLFNQALSAVGNETVVTDPAGPGKAQDMLRLWFPVARQAVFTAAHWPCLRATKLLARAATRNDALPWANTDPAPDYLYSYALPIDMLQPQYMEDFAPFRIGRVGAEKLIFSNNPTPILCYTQDDEVPVNWDADVYRCVVWSLAAAVNMSRSGKMNVTQALEQRVVDLIMSAGENAANADDTYYDALPSFWKGTGFQAPNLQNRFYYPTASFRVSAVAA